LEPGTYYVGAYFQDLADFLGLRKIAATDRGPAEAGSEDHAATYYPSSPEIETSSPVRLRAGLVRSNVDITVVSAPSYSIQGTVTNLPPNAPGLIVDLEPLRAGGLGAHLGYSIPSGQTNFFFRSIPPGEYVLSANLKTDGLPLVARQVIVVSGGGVDGITLNLRTPFPIVGKVSVNGTAGQPKDLKLNLNAVDGRFHAPIKLKSEGTFEVDGGGPGLFTIDVSDETGIFYIKSINLDTQIVETAGISIPEPNHLLQIEVSDKAGRIEGIAVDGEKHPVARGLAVLMRLDVKDSRNQVAVIGANGSFRFQSLAPGKYKLGCFSDLALPTDATWDVFQKVKTEGRELNITEGDKQQITLDAVQVDPS
jgi:hypothetical protein